MRYRKASVFTLVFILALVLAAFTLVWLNTRLASDDSGYNIEVGVLEGGPEQIDIAQTRQNVQANAATAFEAACYRQTFEYAQSFNLDPQLQNGFWSYYGMENAIDLEALNDYLASKIKDDFDLYLKGIEEIEPYVYLFGPTKDVDIHTTDSQVAVGLNDESFEATASDAQLIMIDGQGSTVSDEELDFSSTIDNWRFYMMYRKISEWMNTGCFDSEAMNRMGIVTSVMGEGTYQCTLPMLDDNSPNEIVDSCMEKLDTYIDDSDITCTYEIPCKHAVTNIVVTDNAYSCEPPYPQYVWTCDIPLPPATSNTCTLDPGGLTDCIEDCLPPDIDCMPITVPWEIEMWHGSPTKPYPPNCGAVPPTPPEVPEGNDTYINPCATQAAEDWDYTEGMEDLTDLIADQCRVYNDVTCSDGCCEVSESHEISFTVEVTCTDNKYKQQIGDNGYENLEWKFRAHVYRYNYEEPPALPLTCHSSCNIVDMCEPDPTTGQPPSHLCCECDGDFVYGVGWCPDGPSCNDYPDCPCGGDSGEQEDSTPPGG